MPLPNCEGRWLHKPTGDVIDIYPLDPCGGVLCLWGPDIGQGYTGVADTQGCWLTDEWQGHIPVHLYDNFPDAWECVNEIDANNL